MTSRYIKVTLPTNQELMDFEVELQRADILQNFTADECIATAEEVEELEADEDGDIGDTAILLAAYEDQWDQLLFFIGRLSATHRLTLEWM